MATFSGIHYVGQFDASKLIGRARKGLTRGIGKASAGLVRHYKVMLSVPGPFKQRTVGQVFEHSRAGKTERFTVSVSKPGEPPHYRTRTLLNSVQMTWETPVSARVGTHLLYGLWLELGTSRMRARPWLRRGLTEMAQSISRIITQEMSSERSG